MDSISCFSAASTGMVFMAIRTSTWEKGSISGDATRLIRVWMAAMPTIPAVAFRKAKCRNRFRV